MNTAKGANCKVIIVANQKGGVAKSASAVNLSAALVKLGKKVLMIDADSQGTGSNMFGIDDVDSIDVTLATILEKIINDEDIEPSYGIIKDIEGVDVLPANIDLAALEASLVNVMNRERLLKIYVDIVRPYYDYIIVDCLPSLGMITINALACGDSVLIPVQAEKPAAKGLVQLLKSIIKVKKHINADLVIEGILPTMVDGRLNYSKDVIQMIEDSYGSQIHIYDEYIPRSAKMAECAAVGESIFLYAPKTKAAEAYMSLAKEVIENGTCTE